MSRAVIQPGRLAAGSLVMGRRVKVVRSVIGTALGASVDRLARANRTERLGKSQVSVTTGAAPATLKLACELPPCADQRQSPGVCGASRQSAGGGGAGRGGGMRTGTLMGTGTGFGGVAQAAVSAASKTVTTALRLRCGGWFRGARIAMTGLLWKEARRITTHHGLANI